MDKNVIKKYAIWARTELIERVRQRALKYEVSADADVNADSASDKVLTDIEKTQRAAGIARMREKGYEYVIEEVAYTWFNRFTALRYMEVNNYLPTRVRVFTDENGAFKPQILTEAIHLNMDGLDMEKVYALKEVENNDELYKYLLITQCNALSAVLPQMFKPVDERCKEEKNDYTILLFPDNQLREGSVIEQMVSLIPEDNWLDAVQIIGWLYQYYNSEPKDKVFADLKKNIKINKENIPAATQLFTPDWIVRYMVENSLGRLWLEGHPNDELKSRWKYYLDEAQQEPEVEAQLAEIRKEYAALKPEDILCIDPCMGSGHILAYLFDTLMKIYAAYGYSTRESVQSIIEHNLYGLDIDDRAAQLAYFEVMMTAAKYDNRFLKRNEVPQPHVYAIQESNHIRYEQEFGDFLLYEEHRETLKYLLDVFQDAKEYGSILQVEKRDYAGFLEAWELGVEASLENILMIGWYMEVNERVQALARQAIVLSQKYDVVVTNPPYRGIGDVAPKLQDFVKSNYPDSCLDLSTVCMEQSMQLCATNGYVAMINIPVWMSLAGYKALRAALIHKSNIVNMLHLGRGMFGSDYGTVAFVISKTPINKYSGHYKKFFVKQSSVESEETKRIKFFEGTKDYYTPQCLYESLPSYIIAYWATTSFVDAFTSGNNINTYATVFEGLKTRDKERFLRFWFEVQSKKWKPYAKGGAFRRWYGNNDYVVNWGENGDEVRNFKKSSGANFKHYFTPTITYTAMTMSKFTGRFIEKHIFGGGGGGITASEKTIYLLGLVNSKPFDYIISAMKSTVNYEVGQIGKIPVLFSMSNDVNSNIEVLVAQNIELSQREWDSFEYSWDFQQHPFVRWSKGIRDCTFTAATMHHYYENPPKVSCPLELCYLLWQGECDERFNQLKANEEELNRIFIDIYGLQDELTPEVEDEDVTVRKADLQRDIKSFISYAVGCMFGRYSLYKDGLIFAGETYSQEAFVDKINDKPGTISEAELSRAYKNEGVVVSEIFSLDKDNIIPLCDDEYFEDDIIGLFVKFVEKIYGKEALDANLKFIAEALGGKGTPKEVIRGYFLSDKGFYSDHCKTYQKRPIYWLFDSGKKNGFKALVYMHRYQPDTIARMRTDYVHEQQSRYRTAITDLENRIADVTTSERVRLNKQLSKLRDQSEEIRKYEEKIHHLADQYIAIDLDDGVKVNYAKFQDVLAKIK